MKSSRFNYNFLKTGFSRTEKSGKGVKYLFAFLLSEIAIFVAAFLVPQYSTIFYAVGALGIFMLLYYSYTIYQSVSQICVFDYEKKKMVYTKKSKFNGFEFEQDAVDLSDFDTLLYAANVTRGKYQTGNDIQKKVNKKYALNIKVKEELIKLTPQYFLIDGEKLISCTSRLFFDAPYVGFFLINSKTEQFVFLMEANKKDLENTFYYLQENFKPKYIAGSTKDVSKGVKYEVE